MSLSRDGKDARDLRSYARGTQARLLLGAVLLLFLLGGGLIYFFYGSGAAVMGVLCLTAALVPVLLIAIALWMVDRVVRSRHER
jgi:hypothetical protein